MNANGLDDAIVFPTTEQPISPSPSPTIVPRGGRGTRDMDID